MPAAAPSLPQVAAASVILLVLLGMLGSWVAFVAARLAGWRILPTSTVAGPVPWGIRSIAGVLLLYAGVSLVTVNLFAALRMIRRLATHESLEMPAELTPLDQLVIVAGVNAMVFLLTPVLLQRTCNARLEDLGLRPAELPRALGRGLLAGFLISPVALGIMALVARVWTPEKHPVQEVVLGPGGWPSALLAGSAAVLLAPMTEELLFRGVLLPWLAGLFDPRRRRISLFGTRLADWPTGASGATRLFNPVPESEAATRADHDFALEPALEAREPDSSHFPEPEPALDIQFLDPAATSSPALRTTAAWSTAESPAGPAWAWANLASSLVFAGLHAAQWPAPIPLLLLSLALGEVYRRSGRLWTVIFMHACFNGISTSLMLAGRAFLPQSGPAIWSMMGV